jgi:hypothetical protein
MKGITMTGYPNTVVLLAMYLVMGIVLARFIILGLELAKDKNPTGRKQLVYVLIIIAMGVCLLLSMLGLGASRTLLA